MVSQEEVFRSPNMSGVVEGPPRNRYRCIRESPQNTASLKNSFGSNSLKSLIGSGVGVGVTVGVTLSAVGAGVAVGIAETSGVGVSVCTGISEGETGSVAALVPHADRIPAARIVTKTA
jgi:hypothetical protein